MIIWDYSGGSCCGPQMRWCGLSRNGEEGESLPKMGAEGLGLWWMWSQWMEGREPRVPSRLLKSFLCPDGMLSPTSDVHAWLALSHTAYSSLQTYLGCTALNALETNEIWMAGLLSSLFFQDHCWLITLHVGQAAVRHCPLHLIWEGQAGSFICRTVKTSAVQQSSLLGPWLGTSRETKSEPLTGQRRYHNVHTSPCWLPAWPCL